MRNKIQRNRYKCPVVYWNSRMVIRHDKKNKTNNTSKSHSKRTMEK